MDREVKYRSPREYARTGVVNLMNLISKHRTGTIDVELITNLLNVGQGNQSSPVLELLQKRQRECNKIAIYT